MVQHRRTARIVPVSPLGRVLLLSGYDPHVPDRPYWFTIGGGIEADETPAEAAVRELWEEAGIRVDPSRLGQPFHRSSHSYNFNGISYVSRSTFFALLMAERATEPAAIQPGEVITAARWWPAESVADLQLSSRDIPRIVRLAVSRALDPAD